MRGFELKSNREEESRATRGGRVPSLSLLAEKIICGCPMLALFAVLEGMGKGERGEDVAVADDRR